MPTPRPTTQIPRVTSGSVFGMNPTAGRITAERVIGVAGDRYIIHPGIALRPRSAGLKVSAGDEVRVWRDQHGTPQFIVDTVMRRSPLHDQSIPPGALVEQLFVFDDGTGEDVWFRNDQQVTKLDVREHVPEGQQIDYARWGVEGDRFYMRTTTPVIGGPFVETRTNPRFHVFKLHRIVDRALGIRRAEAEFERTVDPSNHSTHITTLVQTASRTGQAHYVEATVEGEFDEDGNVIGEINAADTTDNPGPWTGTKNISFPLTMYPGMFSPTFVPGNAGVLIDVHLDARGHLVGLFQFNISAAMSTLHPNNAIEGFSGVASPVFTESEDCVFTETPNTESVGVPTFPTFPVLTQHLVLADFDTGEVLFKTCNDEIQIHSEVAYQAFRGAKVRVIDGVVTSPGAAGACHLFRHDGRATIVGGATDFSSGVGSGPLVALGNLGVTGIIARSISQFPPLLDGILDEPEGPDWFQTVDTAESLTLNRAYSGSLNGAFSLSAVAGGTDGVWAETGDYSWRITTVGLTPVRASLERTGTITATTQVVGLTWPQQAGATGYNVWRREGATFVLIGSVADSGGPTTSFTDDGSAGTEVEFPEVGANAAVTGRVGISFSRTARQIIQVRNYNFTGRYVTRRPRRNEATGELEYPLGKLLMVIRKVPVQTASISIPLPIEWSLTLWELDLDTGEAKEVLPYTPQPGTATGSTVGGDGWTAVADNQTFPFVEVVSANLHHVYVRQRYPLSAGPTVLRDELRLIDLEHDTFQTVLEIDYTPGIEVIGDPSPDAEPIHEVLRQWLTLLRPDLLYWARDDIERSNSFIKAWDREGNFLPEWSLEPDSRLRGIGKLRRLPPGVVPRPQSHLRTEPAPGPLDAGAGRERIQGPHYQVIQAPLPLRRVGLDPERRG